jgi:site-specific DNA recombinase
MWMGGPTPMGYDIRERKLVVNHDEAGIVRRIYERYRELGSVRQLKHCTPLWPRGVASTLRI